MDSNDSNIVSADSVSSPQGTESLTQVIVYLVAVLVIIGIIFWLGYSMGFLESNKEEMRMGWYICGSHRYEGIYEGKWKEPLKGQQMTATYVNCTNTDGVTYSKWLVFEVTRIGVNNGTHYMV